MKTNTTFSLVLGLIVLLFSHQGHAQQHSRQQHEEQNQRQIQQLIATFTLKADAY